ncbi:hypothetical protein [Actinomadura madurae]|uniref:hypothetical protein n=1 Tax=Actinomadura madurae TaxID=1993 RepID=UPI0020D22F38|nr:hypothetical protein [Actinomadura madurae]MCQ0009632.1 hypothetical protein [Actinomadura madurae]
MITHLWRERRPETLGRASAAMPGRRAARWRAAFLTTTMSPGPDVAQRTAPHQDAVALVERGLHARAVHVDDDVAAAQPGDERGGPGERGRGGEGDPGHGAGTSMTGWSGW